MIGTAFFYLATEQWRYDTVDCAHVASPLGTGRFAGRNAKDLMLAWVLFAAWPFTRLVHVFSAPIGYLTRPYIVYRSREARPPARGWEPIR